VVDPSIYKDYVLTVLFLKYISDVWKDHHATYQVEQTKGSRAYPHHSNAAAAQHQEPRTA
jgi:type I restriction-modification system DNA methylase subunit